MIFDNNQTLIHGRTPLLHEDAFRRLADETFFRNVSADPSGYDVSWSDEVDLGESELWVHGVAEGVAAE